MRLANWSSIPTRRCSKPSDCCSRCSSRRVRPWRSSSTSASTACSFRIAYGARIAMANCSGSRWGMAVPWMSCTTPAMQASTSMIAPRHASGRCPTSRRESRAGLVVWQRLIGPSCVTTRIRGTSAGEQFLRNQQCLDDNSHEPRERPSRGRPGTGTPCCRGFLVLCGQCGRRMIMLRSATPPRPATSATRSTSSRVDALVSLSGARWRRCRCVPPVP